MVLQVRTTMGSEGNTDEMASDVTRPLIDPPMLEAHSRDRAVNGIVQRGVDRVGAKGDACQRCLLYTSDAADE